jgi:hypothetical protein
MLGRGAPFGEMARPECLIRYSVVWLLCAMLAACASSDGSASSPTTPTPTPTSQQTAAAQSAI